MAGAAWRGFGRRIGHGLVELFYPARCFGCGSGVDEPGLCATCEDGLQAVRAPFCSVCGEPYAGQIGGDFVCSNCSGRQFSFDFAIAGYRASGALRTVIHDFQVPPPARRQEDVGLAGGSPRSTTPAWPGWSTR